jgi:GH25 family lysozyme M1 (1,4-beta-N-acetylmuramidase)
MIKRKRSITAVAAIAAAISMGVIFSSQQSVDAARTDMVDTSNHNGYMTYANYYDMLVHYGVKSVVQKVSEGTSYVDPTAKYNLANAKQAGLYINAYHFARYTTVAGAQAEARHAVASAQAAGLPIGAVLVDDVEASQQQFNSYSSNAANNAAFMAVVQAAGYRTCVYTSGSWVGTHFPISKGWIAAYPNTVTSDEYTGHHGWQWSSSKHFNGSYGPFDVSQLYDDFFTANQKPVVSTVKITPQKTTSVIKSTATQDYAQNGVFYPSTTLNIRTGAGTGYRSIGTYAAGEHVTYNHVYITGGYVWARYTAYSGASHYICLGVMGGDSYGKRVTYTPASHTYYTVRSGDTLGAIAARYGSTYSRIAALSGLNNPNWIYPGQTLTIK